MIYRKRKIWLLACGLITAVGLSVSKPSLASQEVFSKDAVYKPITHFDEITLIRTSCLGWCPSYEIVIRGDGRVDFEGKGDVITRGHASKTLSKEQIKKLIQAVNRVEYTSIPEINITRECISDSPTSSTSVTIGGKRHEIHSCGPTSRIGRFDIGKFETDIDKIVKIEQWLGTERERLILFSPEYISRREAAAEEAAKRGDTKYLMAYAELDDRKSLYRLGLGYSEGLYGLKQDQQKPLDYFIRAANRGDYQASSKLMDMYNIGIGVKQDHGEAYYWQVIRTSNRGIDRGTVRNNLTPAEMSAIEERAKNWKISVEIPSRAKVETTISKWFLKAAEEGDEWAQYDLGEFYISGFDPTIHNVSRAAKWLRKSAQQGNYQAQSELSGIYESGGEGVRQDWAESYFWRKLSAASANNKFDSSVAELLAKHLNTDQKDAADKRIKEWKPTKHTNDDQ